MSEQYVHDEINLRRLVRRLEKSVDEKNWSEIREPRREVWMKAAKTVQQVKYARKLLKTVELYDSDLSPEHTREYDEMRRKLDRVQGLAEQLEQKTAPIPKRPQSILSQIPKPASPPPAPTSPADVGVETPGPVEDEDPIPSADNLLLSPTDKLPNLAASAPILIPSTLPPAATSSTTATAPLHNSQALHQDLSEQLAQMATQLKRNAIHFSQTLEKDQSVVEDTKVKLESNFDVMQKERTRLRDHRGKSMGTTCLVMLAVVLVVVVFMLMISLIRLT